ncbi:MAG TPA: hypothetical protein VL200_03215 [Lacunisphaera sp.]|jgi:hypothetical protein|nr:hypothetical protein [Lacunisphaera sp.]
MNPNRTLIPLVSLAVLLPSAGLILAVSGCADAGYVSGGAVIGADDYDYYPGYEVYYSRRHHYYYYQDGHAWVRRPTPPRTFVPGPSVRMDFHDAPERHHAEVVRRYPHDWRPDRRHDQDRNRDHDHDNDHRDDDDRRRQN